MAPEYKYLREAMADIVPPQGELIRDRVELSQIMGRISTTAHEVGYPNAGYGFLMYKVVTDIVDEWIKNDLFEDSEKMARTVPVFADLAIAPLREAGPWGYFYNNKNAVFAHPVLAAMDFMGDHVDEDLGYALHLTNTEERHRNDYFNNMNTIFDIATEKIIPHVSDMSKIQKTLGIQRAGVFNAKRILHKRRDYAFDARLDYKEAITDEEIQAIRVKHRNIAERRMLSNSKLTQFAVDKLVKPPVSTLMAA